MRSVCGWTPASSAATEMTYKALSSGFIALPSVLRVREQRGARILVEHVRECLDRLALIVVQVDRDLRVDRHEKVAALAPSVALHAPSTDAQHLAARSAGRNPHGHLPVERRHLHVGAERGLCERHGE